MAEAKAGKTVTQKNNQPHQYTNDAHHAKMGSVAVMPSPHPEPQPFVWFPLNGARHAINRDDRYVPLGDPMRCLCGATHPRGPDGEREKTLWPTCQKCWNQACIIAGLRPRQ